jgi:hypothetical protein
LITFVFSLGLVVLALLALLSLSGWSIPADWTANARLAFPKDPEITPLSLHNILTAPGAFFGLAAGWIWLSLQGGFSAQGDGWKLVLRYCLGLIGVLVLYMGLGVIFPETETIISYALRYIRYALVGFWISGLAPWIFVKLKIADTLRSTMEKTKQAGDIHQPV